jgi:hypothetical protein
MRMRSGTRRRKRSGIVKNPPLKPVWSAIAPMSHGNAANPPIPDETSRVKRAVVFL